MKRLFAMMLLFTILGTVAPMTASAGESVKEGDIHISLQCTPEEIRAYSIEHPDGVYVFIREISTNETYQFPLEPLNNYEGQYTLPYGNYMVIPSEKTGTYISCPNVFSLSEGQHFSADIDCKITKVGEDTITMAKTASPTPAPTQVPKEAESESSFSLQTIFTFIVIAIFIGLFIYNKFVRKKR